VLLSATSGGLAHALSGPLQAAQFELDLAMGLVDEAAENASTAASLPLHEARHALGQVSQGLDAAAWLVGTLRLLARPTEETMLPWDLEASVRRAARWVQATAGPNAEVLLDCAGLPMRLIRPGAWLRALVAVLQDAVRAGDSVTVQTGPRDHGVFVRVTAPGWLPSAALERNIEQAGAVMVEVPDGADLFLPPILSPSGTTLAQ
jgi:hypothetical protein